MNTQHSESELLTVSDAAAKELLMAVTILLKSGYGNLPRHMQEACNWANMAREQLLRGKVIPIDYPPLIVPTSVHVKANNKRKNQDLRMAKAARRMANKQRRGHSLMFG